MGLSVWLLIGWFFVLMLVRTGLPFGVKAEGRQIANVSLKFRERLLLHRVDFYAFGVMLLLSAIGGWFSWKIEIVLVLAAFAIVNLPKRYYFTTLGIACNNVLFRKWSDFSAIQVQGSRVTLVPRKNQDSLKLYILPSRQAEILPYLRRYLTLSTEKPLPWYKKLTQVRLPKWIKHRLPAFLLGGLLIFSAMAIL